MVKITSEKRGECPCYNQGDIVLFINDKDEDQYGAVEEPRFQRAEVCCVKYHSQKRVQYFIANMLTGYCFTDHASRGYALVNFMDKRKNKLGQKDVKNKWLPFTQIYNVAKSRRSKLINRFGPPIKGREKEKGFALIQ